MLPVVSEQLTLYNMLKQGFIMYLSFMERACLTRGKETFACSSFGFRNENTSVNTNCTKGGPVCR